MLSLSFRGSAVSLMLTYYLVLFLLVAYIWSSGMYHETWDGMFCFVTITHF